jgi:hypothetical protein
MWSWFQIFTWAKSRFHNGADADKDGADAGRGALKKRVEGAGKGGGSSDDSVEEDGVVLALTRAQEESYVAGGDGRTWTMALKSTTSSLRNLGMLESHLP